MGDAPNMSSVVSPRAVVSRILLAVVQYRRDPDETEGIWNQSS